MMGIGVGADSCRGEARRGRVSPPFGSEDVAASQGIGAEKGGAEAEMVG